MELTSALKAGITEAGLQLVTPMEPELSGGVCIVVVDRGTNARSVMNRLYEEFGIAAAPTGGLRLSPHTYNTMEHIERAIAGVKALLT